MQALALNGDRSGALSEYESCQQVLADEFGLMPAPETISLAEHIRLNEIGMDDPCYSSDGNGHSLHSLIGYVAPVVKLQGYEKEIIPSY